MTSDEICPDTLFSVSATDEQGRDSQENAACEKGLRRQRHKNSNKQQLKYKRHKTSFAESRPAKKHLAELHIVVAARRARATLLTSSSNCCFPNHGYDMSFSTWLWYLWCSLWLLAHGQKGTISGAWHRCPTTALTHGWLLNVVWPQSWPLQKN